MTTFRDFRLRGAKDRAMKTRTLIALLMAAAILGGCSCASAPVSPARGCSITPQIWDPSQTYPPTKPTSAGT
jgi:hypothetical protein